MTTPKRTASAYPAYFVVRVVNAEVVENREDIRLLGLEGRPFLYVDRDARLSTGPDGTRLDTEDLARAFLAHALPTVRARHGGAVALEVARQRATNAMVEGWVYRNSWQIRAILGIAEPPPMHLRAGPTG